MAQSGFRTLAGLLLLLAAIAPQPASLQNLAGNVDPCLEFTDFNMEPPQGSTCYNQQCASDSPPNYCDNGSEPPPEETTGAAQTTAALYTPITDLGNNSTRKGAGGRNNAPSCDSLRFRSFLRALIVFRIFSFRVLVL